MKYTLTLSLFCIISIYSASAQTSTSKPAFVLGTVTPASQQQGESNYLFSLSENDFKNKQYVIYTDSNETVAYININGNIVKLRGGYNPEHIMAYTCQGYTILLNHLNNSPVSTGNSRKVNGTIVVYNSMGRAVVQKITGSETTK